MGVKASWGRWYKPVTRTLGKAGRVLTHLGEGLPSVCCSQGPLCCSHAHQGLCAAHGHLRLGPRPTGKLGVLADVCAPNAGGMESG